MINFQCKALKYLASLCSKKYGSAPTHIQLVILCDRSAFHYNLLAPSIHNTLIALLVYPSFHFISAQGQFKGVNTRNIG